MLTLKPEGGDSPPDWYVVSSGNLRVGVIRLFENCTKPYWQWAINGTFYIHGGGNPTSGGAATREAAMVELRARWTEWLEWCGLQEIAPPSL